MRLKEYLEWRQIPQARFARLCNLKYSQLRYMLRDGCPTLESALKIERGSGGMITPKECLPERILARIYGDEPLA